jgi:hypothetical protein
MHSRSCVPIHTVTSPTPTVIRTLQSDQLEVGSTDSWKLHNWINCTTSIIRLHRPTSGSLNAQRCVKWNYMKIVPNGVLMQAICVYCSDFYTTKCRTWGPDSLVTRNKPGLCGKGHVRQNCSRPKHSSSIRFEWNTSYLGIHVIGLLRNTLTGVKRTISRPPSTIYILRVVWDYESPVTMSASRLY